MKLVVSPASEQSFEFEEIMGFFESLLRHDSRCRLLQEYPLAFDSEHLSQIMISESGGDLCAGFVSLPRDVEVQAGVMAKALFVGSVVTKPAYRHQGYQKRLFEELLKRAEGEGIDFILLWSNQLEFYGRLGFKLGGLQASWELSQRQLNSDKQIQVSLFSSGERDLEESQYQLFQEKAHCVQRTFEEMKRLWKIPQMRIAVSKNAYALMGKGEDFKGYCHEWAGEPKEVLACIDRLHQEEPNLKVVSPGIAHAPEEQAVLREFEKIGLEPRLEYLGLFKLISSKLREEGLSPAQLKYPFFVWGLDSI